MAKQFTLEQPGRDGSTVELNERSSVARTVTVNGARDKFFARAGFAQQEHCRISAGHGFDHLQQTSENRTFSNDAFETGPRAHRLLGYVDMKRALQIGSSPRALVLQR